MKLLNQFGNIDGEDPLRTRYVIISGDGLNILQDPSAAGANGHGLYWSYDKSAAELQCKICRKDFGQDAYVVDLATAVVTLGKRRYGLEFKRPITWTNIERQLNEMLKQGKI